MGWLPETIRALTEMIDKVGISAVMLICSVGAVGFLTWYTKKLVESKDKLSNETITANTVAMIGQSASMNAQAKSAEELATEMKAFRDYWKKLGSDPFAGVCKAKV